MALTAGALNQLSVTPSQAVLQAVAASGGTGPYTYQWYRSTTPGFTPGGGNILSGKTSLNLTDTGLLPNTAYYYKVISTDTGHSNDTVTSEQLAVQTANYQMPNQFAQSPTLGQIDLRFNYNTVSVQIDAAQATPLYAGYAVKIVDSEGGVPKVLGIAADTDEVFGYINFDIKTVQFLAGSMAEVSQSGNVIFLYATEAIARGVQVVPEIAGGQLAGVKGAAGETGDRIIGWAYDKSTAAGQLIRVKLVTPSFTVV